jgi:hypothetical protein
MQAIRTLLAPLFRAVKVRPFGHQPLCMQDGMTGYMERPYEIDKGCTQEYRRK